MADRLTNPTPTQSLDEDVTTAADMSNPQLTYFADGTPVIVQGVAPGYAGEARNGRTGVTNGAKGAVGGGQRLGSSYAFQVVDWDGGGRDAVVPHVLQRLTAQIGDPR